MKSKWIFISFIVIAIMISVPLSFAQDLESGVLAENNNTISVNHYYFDSSADNSGNGSIDSPYKYLTNNTIKENSVLHFAKGDYNFTQLNECRNVSFIGSDVSKTVIQLNGCVECTGQVVLRNITFINTQFSVKGVYNATNIIFKDSTAKSADRYSNSYGGAIYSKGSNEVYVDNCTFINNTAQYGGAIYAYNGILDVKDSIFIDNYAYNYGGAIACEYNSKVKIKNSTFTKSRSLNDAGGAVYLKRTSFEADSLNISDSNATFGAALTILFTDSTLNGIFSYNNTAKYDGGAIYQVLGNLTLSKSSFISNNANNGAGLYVGRCDNVIVNDCLFSNNTAISRAGALYSIINTNMTFERIAYENNSAFTDNDFYNSQDVNPFISNSNYTLYSHDFKLNEDIPSYFMLDHLWIKDQQDGGNCWAFATLASLESCIYKASGEVICLSEENMKNLIALYSDYGWNMDTNYGGYDGMGIGYLVSWLGPVLISDDLYDGQSLLSPVLNSVAHVQNIMYLSRNSYTDNNAFKRAIMNYGGVYTSIYSTGSYEQYYTGTNSNHAVCIVGWDDDKYISRAPGKGAWICKNSWGNWGYNGFFYVSYYDRSCAPVGVSDASYVFIFNDTLKYDKNYQYDIPGKTDYFLNDTHTVWYKNKFTSTDNEYLAAVSTYFLENTNWELSIFVNNALKSTMEGFSIPGYYTIELDDMITLNEGDEFEVVFKITVDGDAGVPISESQSLVHQFYRENISYVSYDGINWVDFYDLKWEYPSHTYKSQVACIKAFTVFNPVNTTLTLNVSLDELDRLNVTALVLNQYGRTVHIGNVIFNINGVDYAVDVDNGIAKISSELTIGLNNISARYDEVGFIPSSQSTTVPIDKIHEKIDLIISKDFGNVNLTVKLARPINETVIVTVAGNPYNLRTKNGIATLNLEDMSFGEYGVNVVLQSETYQASGVNSSFTITPFETMIESSELEAVFGYGDVFKIRLADENSNGLSNMIVTYTIDSLIYTNTTDENGFIYIHDNLAVGSHNLDVKFNGAKWYLNSTFTGKINIISSIILPNSNIYTYNSTYMANFIDKLGNSLSGKVDITINGVKNTVNLVDGVGSAIVLLNPGSYTVRVVNQLNGEEKNQTISVVKRIQDNNDLVTYYGSGDSFKVKALNDNGNIAQGLTITFNIDGKSYSAATDSNGYAYLNLNLNPGAYTLTSSYKGFSVKNTVTVKSTIGLPSNNVYTYNSNYKPDFLDESGNILSGKVAYIVDGVRSEVNAADGLNVALNSGSYVVSVINPVTGEVKNQAVTVVDRIQDNNDLVTYYGSGDSFRVKVLDDNGNAAGNVNVAFAVDGKSYTGVTDSNGYACLNVNMPVGVYTVTSSYKGFSVKNTMTVKSTVGLPENTVYTYNSVYKASFLDKSGNILSGKVAYIVDGVRSEVNAADGLNVALNSGSYVVSVINPVTGEVKNQAVTVVDRIQDNNDLITYYGSGDSFRVKVLDDNGNAAGNVNVAFAVDGKSYTGVTDSNGYASLNVNLPVDVYEVIASYKGFSVKNTITVKSTISLPSATVYTYNSFYRPSFLDKSGNKFTGKVAFVLNGLTSEVNAADDLNIRLNPGTYSVDVINLLTGEVKNQTVNVVKRIQDNNDLTIYYGSDNHYTVKVLDDNGNAAGNVNVAFAVGGKSYEGVTDSNGYASLNADLSPDVYTVSASYKGFSVKNTMTVKSTISLPSATTVYTYNSVYKASFLDKSGNLFSGKVAYIVNGVKSEVNVADGLNIALDPGSHAVSIINLLTGEVKNQTINVVKRITENKDLTTYYSAESSFKVKVLDDNGNAARNVSVAFTVGGKSYTGVTDSNGYASLNINLPSDVYTVSASYKGFSVKNTLTVKSTIDMPSSTVYTYNSVYRPTFLDKSGNKFTGKVAIVLNGIRNEVNAGDGVSIVLNPGSYDVSAINLLTGEVKNQTVNVVERITENKDMTTYYGSDYYKVKVLDDNGNAASNLQVIFTVNGKDYSSLTDSNGYASLNVKLPVDVYTVTASYKGFSVKNTLTVKSTVALPEGTVYTYNSVYRPTFLDKSGNKFTGKVAIVLNGIRNEVNAGDGVSIALNPGSYAVGVINLLTGEVKNQTVNVVERIIENNDLTVYYGSDNQYAVKVLDDRGNVASNLPVTFTVNGNGYSGLTDDMGYASLNVKLSPGVYTVTASYKGFSVKNTLTVKSTVDLPSNDVYTYNSAYKASFLDKSGNKLSGNVAFIFNNIRYDANAKEGIADFNVVLNPGSYAVSVLNPATSEVKNQTIKILSRIQENNNLITYYGAEGSFKVKVLDDNGNAAGNAEVTFNIDGKTYSRLTDSNGYASLDINLPLGIHSITSTSNGYSVKNTVTVKSTIDMPSNEVYTYNAIYKPDFLDKSGNRFTGKVAIVLNGVRHEINALDGIEIALNSGSYNVSVLNLITGEVKEQTISVVERISENSDLTTYYGSDNHYNVKVLDDNGNAVRGLEVTFTIGGKDYFALTDDMGYASLNVNLAPDDYLVIASYKKFTVKNRITIMTTVDLLLNKTDTYDSIYNAGFLDKSGNNLSGKVAIIVDGIKNEAVADNGIASISLNPGTHEVTVINTVTGEVKNQTVNVISKILNNNDLTMYYGAGKYYKVKILDYDGKIAKNAEVTFKINGKTYSKFTNSKGYASIKIGTTFAPKTYTITTVYKDNEVSNKITVKPTLICKNMAVKKGKTFKYAVKLLNNKGKILKYKYVKVTFKGKTYKVKTNSKGIATFKIKVNSKLGKFTITSTYGSAKISKKITVKK